MILPKKSKDSHELKLFALGNRCTEQGPLRRIDPSEADTPRHRLRTYAHVFSDGLSTSVNKEAATMKKATARPVACSAG
jgi:hypothetical protein